MRSLRPWSAPPPEIIASDHELAPLAILDAALAVTLEALLAANPELAPQARTWSDLNPIVLAARDLIVHGQHLRRLIDEYRAKILDDGEIPF